MKEIAMILLALSGAALAQKAGPDTGAEERLGMEAARRSAAELGCTAAQLSAAGQTEVPPVARDASGQMTEGMVLRHFQTRGCEGVGRQNILLLARPGQPLRAMPMLPGETATDPVLQRDAVRPTLTLAAGRLNNCQAARIVDTRVTRPGQTANGRIVSAWTEEWVASGCGATMRIQVTLTPSPQGGTNYRLRAG